MQWPAMAQSIISYILDHPNDASSDRFTRYGSYLPTYILIGMCFGIVLWIQITEVRIYVILGITAALIINYITYHSMKITCACIGFYIGICATYISTMLHNTYDRYGERDIVCIITDVSEITKYQCDFKYRYACRVIDHKRYKTFILKGNDPILEVGHMYAMRAKLFALPKPCTPLSRDMRYLFFFRDIAGFGQIMSAVEMQSANKQSWGYISYLRQQINKLKPDHAKIMQAILLGENKINDATRDQFSKAGIGYIFAISGLHFSIIVAIFYFIGRWIISVAWIVIFMFIKKLSKYSKLHKITSYITTQHIIAQHIGYISALIGCLLYAMIASLSDSAIRNMLSAMIPIIMILNFGMISSYYILIIAMISILIILPYAILSPGMQLSFIASFILTTVRASSLKSTLLLTFVTTPISMYWFGSAPIQPLIGSIICVPIFSFIIMPLSIIAAICGMPDRILYYIDIIIGYFIKLVQIISEINFGEIYIQPSDVSFVIWISSVCLYILLHNKMMSKIMAFIAMYFMFQPAPCALFIDYSGHNIAIHENGIVWALDPTSFHTQEVALISATRRILPIHINNSLMPSAHEIQWRGITLKLTKQQRFHEAIYRGEKIVSRLSMHRMSKPCMLLPHRNDINIIY